MKALLNETLLAQNLLVDNARYRALVGVHATGCGKSRQNFISSASSVFFECTELTYQRVSGLSIE